MTRNNINIKAIEVFFIVLPTLAAAMQKWKVGNMHLQAVHISAEKYLLSFIHNIVTCNLTVKVLLTKRLVF